jgi:L-lysine 6-transaminase
MAEQTHVQPSEVHEVLARHVLSDGMKLVLDLRRSRGSQLRGRADRRALSRHVHILRSRLLWDSIRRASLTTRRSWLAG